MGKIAMRVLAILLAGVCLLDFPAASASQTKGDDGEDEKVYDIGPGVAPPRVTKQVPPRSSNRGVRVVGSVIVALIVSSRGIPRDVRVTKGLDKEVDQSTVEAVEQWRFAPAQKDGKAVAVRISLEIAFHDM